MTLVWPQIQLSENIKVRIVGSLGRPEHLQQPVALLAEAVDPEAILFRIDQAGEPLPQSLLRPLVKAVFKDRVLHPFPEVLERVGETGAPAIVGNIIGDQDQDGNWKGSYSWPLSAPQPYLAGARISLANSSASRREPKRTLPEPPPR